MGKKLFVQSEWSECQIITLKPVCLILCHSLFSLLIWFYQKMKPGIVRLAQALGSC